jgi:hypothetical protein
VITTADIEAAERILGIAYTATERHQMVGNLDGQIVSANARQCRSPIHSQRRAGLTPGYPHSVCHRHRGRFASATWSRVACHKTMRIWPLLG